MPEPVRLGEIQSRSLRTQVLDRLRDAILDGELKPGEQLVESDLAAQLGVSRAPLREALQVLQAEGLVEIIPYRGSTVRALTRSDVEELYSLRSVLESFAIQRIIARAEPDDIEALHAIYESMLRAAQTGRFKTLNDEDLNFHETLIRLSGHKLLLSMWQQVGLRVRQVVALRNKQNSDLSQIARNHLPLLEAMIARDTPRACELITRHIESAADILIERWQYPDAAPTHPESIES